MPVLLLLVLATVVGCAAGSWIAFALTVLGVPAGLVLLGSLAERSRRPHLTTLTRRLPEPRPAVSGVGRPRLTRAERRRVRERAVVAERKRHAADIERLAVEFGLPNPTYEKFVAEEQARLRKIREAFDNPQ